MSDNKTLLVNGVVVDEKVDETVIPFVEDEFGGVVVEMKTPMDPTCFASALRFLLEQWRSQNKKGIWLNLPLAHANLVEPAVQEGFKYHHAEPNYLMLVYWIPETESTLPLNASHRVCIAAVVLNPNNEILVVQEKYGTLSGTGVWKIPTGAVNEGEDIFSAAIREVKEETGIDTEFLEVLAFCQNHKTFFTKSDVFFICLLRPTSFDIQKQDQEIDAAQWMPFEDSASQPITHTNDLFKVVHRICSKKMENSYTGFTNKPTTTFFDDKLGYIYLNQQDLNNLLS